MTHLISTEKILVRPIDVCAEKNKTGLAQLSSGAYMHSSYYICTCHKRFVGGSWNASKENFSTESQKSYFFSSNVRLSVSLLQGRGVSILHWCCHIVTQYTVAGLLSF